jgi:hypothetical protein
VGDIQRRIIIDKQVVILQSVNWLKGVKKWHHPFMWKTTKLCVGSEVLT